MRLDSIEVQNFFNHKYTLIDLTKQGSPVLVQGENGAGKSSLFNEALTFAIFGETRMNSVDDAIRNGSNEMAVAVKFNLNGQDVEIMRTKKRGKSAKLTLTVDGVASDELLSETQARILKMFGLSLNSFLSSIILKQEDSDFFVKQKPDERKKIIGEILDLAQYERLEKIARDQRAALKSEMKIEEAAYNNIEVKDPAVLQQKFQALSQYAVTFATQLEAARSELDAEKARYALIEQQRQMAQQIHQQNQQVRQMVIGLVRKVNAARDEIKSLAPLLSEQHDYEALIDLAEKHVDATEVKITEADAGLQERVRKTLETKENLAQAINAMLQIEMDKRTEAMKPVQELLAEKKVEEAKLSKIRALHDPECPTCLRKIDAAEHRRIVEDIQELIMQIDSKVLVLSEPVKAIQTKIDSIQKNEHPEIIRIKNKIADDEVEIKAIQADVAKQKSELATYRSELRKKIENKQKFAQARQKFEMLTEQIEQDEKTVDSLEAQIQPELVVSIEMPNTATLEAKVRDLDSKRDQALKAASTVEAEIAQNEVAQKRKADLEDILRSKIHKVALLDKLCTAFSRKGIPASIIETVLPEIEEIANHFLHRMSNGRLAIQFKTTEVQKNGNEKDTLEVEVFDGQEWRRFESFSGGEQFRISLSIRLALSKVLARRANIDLQVLILDEAATSLDQPGREEFVETVLSLRNDFSRIILMSHIPELADEFEHRITITRSQDGSRLIGKR